MTMENDPKARQDRKGALYNRDHTPAQPKLRLVVEAVPNSGMVSMAMSVPAEAFNVHTVTEMARTIAGAATRPVSSGMPE